MRDVLSQDDGEKEGEDGVEEKVEEEVSTKDSDHVALNVDEDDDDDEDDTESKSNDQVMDSELGGWLWEMVDLKRERRRRRRRKRKKRRKKKRKKKEKEEESASSDSETESDSDSLSSLSSSSPKYVMKWSDTSKPIKFRPLPSYVNDVTLPDIAEASKLTLGKKMQWFRKRLASLRIPWDEGHVKIEIRRDSVRGVTSTKGKKSIDSNINIQQVLSDALGAFDNISIEPRNFHKVFRFEFMGEPAVDAGGVAREFFEIAVKHLFRPDFGLFKISRSATYWINQDAACAVNAQLSELLG